MALSVTNVGKGMRVDAKSDALLRAQLRADRRHLAWCAQQRDDAAVRVIGWGEAQATFSPQMIRLAELLFPDLRATDRATRTRAWNEFVDSDYGRPYRVQPQSRHYV